MYAWGQFRGHFVVDLGSILGGFCMISYIVIKKASMICHLQWTGGKLYPNGYSHFPLTLGVLYGFRL